MIQLCTPLTFLFRRVCRTSSLSFAHHRRCHRYKKWLQNHDEKRNGQFKTWKIVASAQSSCSNIHCDCISMARRSAQRLSSILFDTFSCFDVNILSLSFVSATEKHTQKNNFTRNETVARHTHTLSICALRPFLFVFLLFVIQIGWVCERRVSYI